MRRAREPEAGPLRPPEAETWAGKGARECPPGAEVMDRSGAGSLL